ncbi:MAG: cellulose synthase family protein [Acidobacteriota bacterium]
MSFLGWLVLALYYLILGLLAVYGTHRLSLVVRFWRARRAVAEPPAEPESWPLVTVQLPIFNELYVAERLIEAVCGLDYPRDRLEIQVLDDSTDETAELVATAVARYRDAGVDIHHLRRDDRSGFKAGALAAGLEAARGDLVAIFDADFVPAREFLRRSVPFFADPKVGLVQARWGHLNRDFSLLTRVQAILLDGHFVVEHTARARTGCFFNFNGTAGIWRREAIDDSGGWQHDTLTEDLDLSYRAQLDGWDFVYLPDLVVDAELPAEINAFKSQQHRWAKGSIQTGRKMLGRVTRAKLPLRTKLEALVHLTNNWSYVLMVALSVLLFPAMLFRRGHEAWTVLAIDLPLFIAATVSVLIFYTVSQLAQGEGRGRLLDLPAMMGVGIGLAINNSRAVLSGARHLGGVFHRTPKYRVEGTSSGWLGERYRLSRNLSFWIELAFALYFIVCTAWAIYLQMWWSLPFMLLFLHGYAYMALLGLIPQRRTAVMAGG